MARTTTLAAVILILSSGCASPPTTGVLGADAVKIRAAVRSVMAEYDSAREEGEGAMETGWEPEPVSALDPPPRGTLRVRARYKVDVRGSSVEVSALVEAFIRFGPHATRWERVPSRGLEERLIRRVEDRLDRPSE